MRQEQSQKENKPENSSSNMQKIANFFTTLFCGNEQNKVINRSIVFNTYTQIAQLLYILSLYTWFNKTNNATYYAVQAIFSGFSIIVCMIPRLIVNMNRHYGLLTTLIVFLIITVGSICSAILLLTNFFTFKNYCTMLSSYAARKASFNLQSSTLCDSIIQYYWMVLGANGLISIIRVVYIYLIIKAYETAKEDFNQEQKRRRRKEKFDQNRKNKNPQNTFRKI